MLTLMQWKSLMETAVYSEPIQEGLVCVILCSLLSSESQQKEVILRRRFLRKYLIRFASIMKRLVLFHKLKFRIWLSSKHKPKHPTIQSWTLWSAICSSSCKICRLVASLSNRWTQWWLTCKTQCSNNTSTSSNSTITDNLSKWTLWHRIWDRLWCKTCRIRDLIQMLMDKVTDRTKINNNDPFDITFKKNQ